MVDDETAWHASAAMITERGLPTEVYSCKVQQVTDPGILLQGEGMVYQAGACYTRWRYVAVRWRYVAARWR